MNSSLSQEKMTYIYPTDLTLGIYHCRSVIFRYWTELLF